MTGITPEWMRSLTRGSLPMGNATAAGIGILMGAIILKTIFDTFTKG